MGQLIFLFVFHLLLDHNTPLLSTLTNHHSMIFNKSDVDAYLNKKLAHETIAGPLKNLQIQLHVAPFLTRQ